MAGLQLSGLASGFDWKSFIDQIMDAERAPIRRLQTEKTTNTSKLSALDSLGTRLTDLQTSVRALKVDGLFAGRATASTTTNSSWVSSASSGTTPGTYTIAVSQLATAAKRNGASDIGSGIAATNDVSGVTLASMATATAVTAGTFSVNGAKITVATTDSLQTVFNNISTATGGAVTASYDSTTDRISLTSATAITLGASNDTSNFLSVARLASGGTTVTSSGALGTTSINSPLASGRLRTAITAVDGSGNGSFSINGTSISYNVNTESLSAVLSKINSSAAGVTATYDSALDRVIFTNKTTGNIGLSVSEAAGGFLEAIGQTSGATVVAGVNAQYTINGGATLTSLSNTLDSSSHGITGLSVTVNSQTTESIAVTSNTAGMKSAIEDFIKKFNSVQTYIDEQTKVTSSNGKVTSALLASNREIQTWNTTLRSTAFAAVSGLSGTIQRLEHMGIDFTAGTSQLAIKDSAKLDAALRDKPSEVEAFFKTATTGFVAKLEAFTVNLLGTTGSNGSLSSQKTTLTTGNTSIDRQIADIERRLASEKSRLEAGFLAMEQAQSRIQQMQQQLTSALGQTATR